MKFSMGFWDKLFGKKMTIHGTNKDGNPVEQVVTKKWFDSMVEQKKIDQLIKVHLLDPVNLYQQDFWKIGEDIDQETYEQFKTEENELYVVKLLDENNKVKTIAVKPEIFEEMYQKMKAVDEKSDTYKMKAHVFDVEKGYWETELTIGGEDGFDLETVEKYQSENNELHVLYLKNGQGEKEPVFVSKNEFVAVVESLGNKHINDVKNRLKINS